MAEIQQFSNTTRLYSNVKKTECFHRSADSNILNWINETSVTQFEQAPDTDFDPDVLKYIQDMGSRM